MCLCCVVVFFLQDVLKSTDVELEAMFKLSFAYDIVNVSVSQTALKYFQHQGKTVVFSIIQEAIKKS